MERRRIKARNDSATRAEEARRVGISKGLGIPCQGDIDKVWVRDFLSALGTPIARRFELWTPAPDASALVFRAGDCEIDAAHAAAFKTARIAPDEGMIGEVWLGGMPGICHASDADSSVAGASARAAGLSTMFALPVYSGEFLKTVVAMYF